MSSEWRETYIGTIPRTWNVINLGDLGDFKNGINFSRKDFGKGVPVVNVKNLFDGRFVSTQELDEVIKERISNVDNYLLEKDDILFARSSVTIEGAGQVSMVNTLPENYCVFSSFIIRFRNRHQDKLNSTFLNYLLRSPKYRQYLIKIAIGTAIAIEYTNLQCIQCALAIKTYLIVQKIKGKLIKISAGADLDFRNSFLYDDSIPGDAISETGYHEGVSVIIDGVEIVFDNNHPDGLPKPQWLANFQFFGKIHLGQELIIIEESF